MDEITNNQLARVLSLANEHAQRISSLVIQSDDDLKVVKKERAEARKYIKKIQEKITENRQRALKEIEEENQIYIDTKKDIEKIYSDFFHKVDVEITLREIEKKEAFVERVKKVIDEESFTISADDVTEEIYKEVKNLKTNKKLIELLKELEREKSIIKKNRKSIIEKANSLNLSPKKYIAMYDEKNDVLKALEEMDRDSIQIDEEVLERSEELKKEQIAKELEQTKRTEELRSRLDVVSEKETKLDELIKEQQEKEKEKIKQLTLEKRMLEQENKNKVIMEVVYEKTEENSKRLNELLSEMRKIAEVKLRKEI